MKTYQINFTDAETGATSAIDTVKAPEGYTAEQYLTDCEENADAEWCNMINRGTITVIEVE